MELTIQIIGWIGTFFVIAAYLLISHKKVDGDSKLYQTMNLLGAIGVGINVFHQHAWPAVALQVIWGAISVMVLIKTIANK